MWIFTPNVLQFMICRGMELAGLQVERQGMDRQSPTLSKLIGHACHCFLYHLIDRAGLSDAAPPFGVPLPGIVSVRARANTEVIFRSARHD